MKRALSRIMSIVLTTVMISSSAAMPAYAAPTDDTEITNEAASTADEQVTESEAESIEASQVDETEVTTEEISNPAEGPTEDIESSDEETAEETEEAEETESAEETSTPEESKEKAEDTELVGDGDFVIEGTTLKKYTGEGGEVVIPADVWTIDSEVFANYTTITKVSFAEDSKLTTIKGSAFKGCKNLTSIELPDTLQEIGSYAFDGSGLTAVTLPKNLTNIGTLAFQNCGSLKKVTINTTASMKVGITGSGIFTGCAIEEITFNDAMTAIPANIFYKAGIVPNYVVTIPASVKSIGEYAFAETNIANPVFTDNKITSIGGHAFQGCKNLTSIELPDTLQEIGSYAFEGSGLTAVTLPKNLTNIGTLAFQNCGSLKKVTINTTASMKVGITGSGIFTGCAIEEITFNDAMTAIPANIFYKAGIVPNYVVTIPASVKSIGEYAFAETDIGCLECAPGGNLKTICNYAFKNCNLLTDIYLESGVTTIQDHVFDGVNKQSLTFHAPSGSYAIKWAKNHGFKTDEIVAYSITYVLDGGKNSAANPATYMKGRGISKFAKPSKTGYTFEGWYSDSAKTTPKVGIADTETGAVTVYAKWRINEYTVVFDKNADNATETVADKNLKYNEAYKLPTTDIYTRPRYKQTGWNTKADGTGKTYKFGSAVKNLSVKDKDTVTLYAVWAPSKFTIKYDLNAEAVDGKITGSIKDQVCAYDTTVRLSSVIPKATGYKVVGWSYDQTATPDNLELGKEIIARELDLNKQNELNGKAEADNSVTLYAIWESATEYTLNIYSEPKNAVGESTTMKTYKLKYGESVNIAGLFTKPDYSLASYKDDKGKTVAAGEVKNLTTTDKDTVNLYAQWKANAYGITYVDSKEGIGSAMKNANKTKSFTVETANITLKNPTKEGYKFAGWTVSAEAGDPPIAPGTVTVIERGKYHQPIVLTANWTAQDVTYKIMLKGDGNPLDRTEALEGAIVNKNPVTFANTKNITLKKPSITGYTFMGWYDDDKCTQKNGKISKSTTESTDPVVKYALFAENTYKLVINGNNKKKDKNTYNNVKYSEVVNLAGLAVKDEVPWTYDTGSSARIMFFSTKANGKGTNYEVATEYSGLSAKNKATVTLYAIWDTYRITYIDAEAELSSSKMKNSSSNPVIYTTSADPKSKFIRLKKPTKTGYAFKSWESEKEGAVTTDDRGNFVIDRGMSNPADIDVKASWTANTYKIYLYPNARDVKYKKIDTETVAVSNSRSAGKCVTVTATYDSKQFNWSEIFTGQTKPSTIYTSNLEGIQYARPGYLFKEWNTKANGKGKTYTKEEVLNLTAKAGGSATLYAIWTKVAPARVTGVYVDGNPHLSFDPQEGADGYQYQNTASITGFGAAVINDWPPEAGAGGSVELNANDHYVRVRAYTNDSTGERIYGPWSFIRRY